MSDERMNRVALILRSQGVTYLEIGNLLRISTEDARKAVWEGMRAANVEKAEEAILGASEPTILDQLSAWRDNYDNRGNLVRKAKSQNVSVTLIAKTMGVTRGMIYRWMSEEPVDRAVLATDSVRSEVEVAASHLWDAIRHNTIESLGLESSTVVSTEDLTNVLNWVANSK